MLSVLGCPVHKVLCDVAVFDHGNGHVMDIFTVLVIILSILFIDVVASPFFLYVLMYICRSYS